MTEDADPPNGEQGSVEKQLAKADPPPAPTNSRRTDGRPRPNVCSSASRSPGFIGYGALIAVVIEVVLADVAFFLYGFLNDWKIPAGALTAWLAAIVIQVIGVVLVVAKDIFPGPPSAG